MSWFLSVAMICTASAEDIQIGAHTFVVETLDNGLQAVAVADGQQDELSVFVIYSVGHRMEASGQLGLAHLVEHALFSGTEDVPMGELIETVESTGGEANAYTRDDYTAYYNHRIPAGTLDTVLSLEADRMRGLAFRPADVTEEQRRLVVEEQGARHPNIQIDTRRDFTVYGGQSYGAGVYDVAGNSDAARLPLSAVREFYDRWYHPQRAAVVVVGGDPSASLSAIGEAFGDIPPGPGDLTHAVRLDGRFPEPGEVSFQTALTRDRLEWVWRGPSMAENPDRLALEMLATIYGNRKAEDGSPVEVVVDGNIGSSLFIMAATGDGAEQTLIDVHQMLLKSPISTAVMDEARELIRTRYTRQTLRSRPYFSLAVDVAVLSRWGLGRYPVELPERLNALTPADLKQVASRWLQPQGRWVVRFEADASVLGALPTDKRALAEVGESAMQSGDLPRAIAAYEKLLELGANAMNTVIYRYYLGNLNYQLGQMAEARRQLEAGLAVVDYPALRELLAEINAAAGGAPPPSRASAPIAEPGATPRSGFTVKATTGDAPPDWVSQANAVMARLEEWRSLPFRADLVVEFAQDLGEGLAGFYEPDTERLVVGLGNSERFNQGTMLHEMFHALQDQHFDLSALHEDTGESIERQRALSAVIEGEAMYAVADLMDYNFSEHAVIPTDGPLESKRFESIFRYGVGQDFIRHLYTVGGWELVGEAFRSPPRTTAEIYHPERYLAGWAPLDPRKLPRTRPQKGEVIVAQESTGEYGLRIFLAGAPEGRPLMEPLGAALRGDLHTIFHHREGERVRMAWVMVFEDAHSAEKLVEVAPLAGAAVGVVQRMEIEPMGYLRRANGWGVRLSWRVAMPQDAMPQE